MKRRLAAILTVLCFIVNTESQAQQAADYYPLQKGNTWSYVHSDTDADINGPASYTTAITSLDSMNGGTCFRVKTMYPDDTGSTQWLDVNPGGSVAWHALGAANGLVLMDWKPPVILLRHDAVKAGTSWKYDHTVRKENGGAEIATFHFKVESVDEDITVKAGSFTDCIKLITRHVTPGESPTSTTIWYAPGVGKVKSVQTEPHNQAAEYELAEYNVYGE